jgi:hypothetical protein
LSKAPAEAKSEPERPRRLTPEAERALAEAQERRRLADERVKANPPAGERDGPDGPEPTRYGDWEKNGLASDF